MPIITLQQIKKNARNWLWLVAYLPSEKYDFVSWDHDIPNWTESHKNPWFQTTNQVNMSTFTRGYQLFDKSPVLMGKSW